MTPPATRQPLTINSSSLGKGDVNLFFLIHVFVLAISLAPYYIKRNCVCVCAHVYHMQMPVEAEKNLGSCELPDVGAGTECESSVRTHVLLTAELSSPRVHYIISLCS